MANTYVLIEAKTLSSNTTSVTFSSIPDTYKELELRMSTRVTSGSDFANLKLALNGNTTDGDYLGGYSQGSGTSYTAQTTTARHAGVSSTSSNTANVFSVTKIFFPKYANTSWEKNYHLLSVSENNATNSCLQIGSFSFASTSAINSIQIIFTADILTNSTFNLYGIS
jgi:hypothetical protein